MREIRVSNPFFDDVDQLFPVERGPSGQPSADDFVRYVVPTLISQVGNHFDSVPATEGVKAFVLPGVLVSTVVVYAGEMPTGSSTSSAWRSMPSRCSSRTSRRLVQRYWFATDLVG